MKSLKCVLFTCTFGELQVNFIQNGKGLLTANKMTKKKKMMMNIGRRQKKRKRKRR